MNNCPTKCMSTHIPYTGFYTCYKNSNRDLSRADYFTVSCSVSGKWNDAHCSTRYGFICKVRVGASPTPPAPTLSLPGNCPSGFHGYNNRCYRVYVDTVNWTTALSHCKSLGPAYTLASIRNDFENGEHTEL